MRVSKIEISNILGIQELEIEPGAVTVLRGQNATGKTSVLEALKSVVKGGHDSTLLRQGAAEGEIVLVMDSGMRIRKRITESRSSVSAHHPAYGPLKQTQTWLKKATDALSVNPVAFLTDPKRADRLLEAIPMPPDLDSLSGMLAGVGLDLPPEVQNATHALPAIASVRKVVYQERTGVNRVAKDAAGSVRQLRDSLPGNPPPEPGDLERLAREVERARNAQAEQLHRIDLSQQARVHRIDETAASERESINAEAARRLASVNDRASADRTRAVEEADAKREEVRSRNGPLIEAASNELAAAQERAEQAKSYDNTRAIIEDQKGKATDARRQSEVLTDLIRTLDGIRDHKAADLPVAGLEIRDGEIYLDGIPFPRLNRAKQVQLAVEVAKLRIGEIPLVCLDGVENLDSERFELLTQAFSDSGLQAIIATVSDDVELQVEEAA